MAPLERIHFDTHNRPVMELVRPYGDGSPRIEMSPPYQRGHVWTREQRLALIQSLIEGIPIGAIFLNDRDVMEPLVVVDGKQRLETVRQFLYGELDVPAKWFPQNHVETRVQRVEKASSLDLVKFSGLSPGVRSRITNNWTVATYTTRYTGDAAEARERELFNRINFGGTQHERKA